jgi:hypothetical protein
VKPTPLKFIGKNHRMVVNLNDEKLTAEEREVLLKAPLSAR